MTNFVEEKPILVAPVTVEKRNCYRDLAGFDLSCLKEEENPYDVVYELRKKGLWRSEVEELLKNYTNEDINKLQFSEDEFSKRSIELLL